MPSQCSLQHNITERSAPQSQLPLRPPGVAVTRCTSESTDHGDLSLGVRIWCETLQLSFISQILQPPNHPWFRSMKWLECFKYNPPTQTPADAPRHLADPFISLIFWSRLTENSSVPFFWRSKDNICENWVLIQGTHWCLSHISTASVEGAVRKLVFLSMLWALEG